MRFEFEWNPAEYRRLYRKVAWLNPERRSTLVLTGLMLVAAIYFGVGMLRAVVRGETATWLSIMPWFLVVVLWLLAMVWWVPYSLARRQGKLHGGPQAIEFGEERVKGFSRVGATELVWSAFTSARETSEFFILFFGGGNAYYLPKRAVSDAGELRALRDLLRQKLGERAVLEGDSRQTQ